MTRELTNPAGTLRSPPPHDVGLHALARALGCFSLAIGLVEVIWPRQVARAAELGEPPDRPGLPRTKTLVRAHGLRELTVGGGLLTAAEPESWAWGRVAGDVLDLATLALAPVRHRRGPAGASRGGLMLATLALTALDLYCARGLRHERLARQVRPHDWSRRSGFPRGAMAMRGAASRFVPPRDMRTPELLRPWTNAEPSVH